MKAKIKKNKKEKFLEKFKKVVKERFKEYLNKAMLVLITIIVTTFITESTRDFRENLSKAPLKFEISNISDQSNYEIDVEFTAMDDSITGLYSVKFNKKYYLKPGDYKYTIFIKNLLLSQSNITIVKGLENKIWINNLPKDHFMLMVNVDKKIYGRGDRIFTTISSTQLCWFYLFTYKNNKFEKLTNTFWRLDPYEVITLNQITANKNPGKDNIICVAVRKNDENIIKEALNWLINDGKADSAPINNLWRTKWVSIIVE